MTRLVFPWPSITPKSIRFSKIYNLYSLWPSPNIVNILWGAGCVDAFQMNHFRLNGNQVCVYNINIWALVKIRMLLGTCAFRRCCIPPFLFKRRKNLFTRDVVVWLEPIEPKYHHHHHPVNITNGFFYLFQHAWWPFSQYIQEEPFFLSIDAHQYST